MKGGVVTLTKADLAQKIANDCGFMKGEAAELLDKLLDIIKTRLIAGEDVMISGFGKWTVKSKHARRGRNPQTGEELILDARKVITWKYSPVLKTGVNQYDVDRHT
jgi:integration host factor subunit alpha